MILSASRRTDIPAFHGEWLLDRLNKGTVTVANPFNPKMQREISLNKEDIDGFVFWTRYPLPFFPCLDFIEKQKIPYYFLFTLNDYPGWLEPGIPDFKDAFSALKKLHSRIEKNRIIWRYDPVIWSADTDISFHKKNFSRLAKMISPYVFRVVVSFLDWYPKVVRRFDRSQHFIRDIRKYPERYEEITFYFSEESRKNGLEIQICAENPADKWNSIKNGKCVDEQLFNRQFGLDIAYKKDRSQRPHCLCQQSVDIGTYGTCDFGCLYCYAR